MIKKKIHYCWFGKGDMPKLVQTCIASWHTHMPDWEYKLWDEETITKTILKELSAEQNSPSFWKGGREGLFLNWLEYMPIYVQEAYAAKKYAFVSDYVRLWALEREGGVYLDTDVEALKSLEPLLEDTAFIGLEESLALLPGTCVMGCKAHCQWVKDMLATYDDTTFLKADGTLDMTTNVQRLGTKMVEGGLKHERNIQYIPQWGLRVYTHDYFSPITSTRVMRKSKNTYCIHRFAGSWMNSQQSTWRNLWIIREGINVLVQLKRKFRTFIL